MTTPKTPRPLFRYSGPAGQLRLALQRAQRLRLLAEAGPLVWTYGGRSVKVSPARLMRAVMEEVEK